MSDHAIFSQRVDVARLPADSVEIVASDAERAALASAYDLVAVNALSAVATLTPGPRGSVAVEGRVVADIVQTCVVSLVPVDQHVDEPFSVRFVRAADAPRPPKPGVDLVVEPNAEDPPEILEGPAIDVGAIAEEAFVLAIDPYPRAQGAALPADVAPTEKSPADSPFAALAVLAKEPQERR